MIDKKELAENIYWKIKNDGFLYWPTNYCKPDNAPNYEAKKIMEKIKKTAVKLERLETQLFNKLKKHSDEIK